MRHKGEVTVSGFGTWIFLPGTCDWSGRVNQLRLLEFLSLELSRKIELMSSLIANYYFFKSQNMFVTVIKRNFQGIQSKSFCVYPIMNFEGHQAIYDSVLHSKSSKIIDS